MPDDRSKSLGEYTLHEQIGAGGMGVVYRATHSRLGRMAAIKLIRGEGGGARGERFEIEARAAAKLEHPGIVPIYELGVEGDQTFLALGYIEGETLAQKIARGPMTAEEASRLLIKICSAMHYAHQQGVIHRDLKPANILLDKQGQPHVADFGLARLENDSQGLTLAGDILGTPGYMAPEQCAGLSDEIGAATDVYALGAVLYCLLTGFPPFQAATARETIAQVLEREANSPRLLNSEIPRDLELICLKCLQKERGQRYASAAELESDLEAFLEGGLIAARPRGVWQRVSSFSRQEARIPQCGVIVAALSLVLLCITLVSLDERSRVHTRTRQRVNELTRNLELIETRWNLSPPDQRDKDSNAAMQIAKGTASELIWRGGLDVSGAGLYLLLNSFAAIGGFFVAWRMATKAPTLAATLWTTLLLGITTPLLMLFGIGMMSGSRGLAVVLQIPAEVAATTLGKLSLAAAAVMGVCCAIGLVACRANHEKFEYRRLGSRQRQRVGATLLAARLGLPKIAVLVVMIPLSLALLAGTIWLTLPLLGDFLLPLRIELVLAISSLLALALIGEYFLASRTIWGITQDGKVWKLITRAGATLETPTAPRCYRISFGEAALIEVSYTLLGGRVDQGLKVTKYWIVIHRGLRYLFYAKEPIDLAKRFEANEREEPAVIATDPFASTADGSG